MINFRTTRAVLVTLLVAVAGLVGCSGWNEEGAPAARTVEVPDFTDGSLYEAILEIREVKLSYAVTGEGIDPEQVKNTREFEVVSQNPEPGQTVNARHEVELVVQRNGDR